MDLAHGEVGDIDVESKGAVGACGVALPLGVAVDFIVYVVGAYAVGHVDVAVPRAVQPAGAGFGREVQRGVVIVGREGAGLITAVEGKDAEGELGLCVFVKGEVFAAEVLGVEPSPDGVVVAAGGAHADVVAHDIRVGAGFPAEAHAVEEGIDGAEAQRAGCCGDVVLIEKTCGVGGDGLRCGVAGEEAVAYGVGTDDAMEGVGIVCVGKGGQEREIGLVGETTIELIALDIGQTVPAQVAHMMAHDNGASETKGGGVLRGGGHDSRYRSDEQQ